MAAILDLWTPVIGDDPATDPSLPRWVPNEDRRRLKAYEVLDKLFYLDDDGPDTQIDMRRVRLGAVPYAIQVLRDLTVGGKQHIKVRGADAEGADTTLANTQKSLEDWARRSKLFPKIQHGEETASRLGDVFYRIRVGRWRGKNDVKLDVIHPSFVFPTYNADEELSSVTLLWEEVHHTDGVEKTVLYRDTYRIVDDTVRETAGWYEFKRVPSLDDLKLDRYDTTPDGTPINDLDLGIPVIPIYHLTNFYTDSGFGQSDLAFVTDLCEEINATDTDLAAAASLLGIPPLVVAGLKGRVKDGESTKSSIEVGAGKVYTVDTQGGKVEYLDNSLLLKCLTEYGDRMETKLFRGLRLGKLFSGQTDNIRDIESAGALKTLLASLYARIDQKRTVRETFYSDLLDGVREMHNRLNAEKLSGEALSLQFGNVVPLDNAQDLHILSEAWNSGKGFLSAETAARMGQKAGTGVSDVDAEAKRVKEQLGVGKEATPTAPAKKFTLSPKSAA
jgi:hypothetical protein